MNNNYFTNTSGFNFGSSSTNPLSSSQTEFKFGSSNPFSSTINSGSSNPFSSNPPSETKEKRNDFAVSAVNPDPTFNSNITINKPQSGNGEQFVFLLAESKINLKQESVIKRINCETPHAIQKGTKIEVYLKVPGYSTENIDIMLQDQKIIIQGKRLIPYGDYDYERIYEVFTQVINVYPETKLDDIMVKTYFGMLIVYVEIPSNRLPQKINFKN
jgi:HSP20 family molecular chaperone IbpA